MSLVIRPDRTAEWRGRRFVCSIGRSGIRRDKREGDGATPAGDYALARVLYRPDRLAPPPTCLPLGPIDPADGWCDAPGDPLYNRPVRLPYPASSERLWRTDHVYDLVVVTSHNADPVVRGAGSAIFVHVRCPDGSPTEGCVAFELPDLREILAAWRPEDRLLIPDPGSPP
jgi:L,D-peptidoglycan transpeptidase YkuD (ErfK/YbiS/YcfS/YnhG family)